MQKKINGFLYRALHILEWTIAMLTLLVLVFLIGYEIYKMFSVDGYFASADNYLKNILTIVVGLEFVRMLINLTPANTIEVLIVAIARQVIMNHDNALGNVACIVCIAGLFAIRKFLISKNDFKREMSEDSQNGDSAKKDDSEKEKEFV